MLAVGALAAAVQLPPVWLWLLVPWLLLPPVSQLHVATRHPHLHARSNTFSILIRPDEDVLEVGLDGISEDPNEEGDAEAARLPAFLVVVQHELGLSWPSWSILEHRESVLR